MSKGTKRRFSPECKEQSVAWLSEPVATLDNTAFLLHGQRRHEDEIRVLSPYIKKAWPR